jgi:hypothetical protein
MAHTKPVMISVCDNTLAFLDAVAARHGLRSRSEALRHVASALAPVYNTIPPQVVLGRGAGAAKAQSRFARDARYPLYEPIRPYVQPEHLAEFADWLNDGRSPSDEALSAALAAGLPRSACEAAFGRCPEGAP